MTEPTTTTAPAAPPSDNTEAQAPNVTLKALEREAAALDGAPAAAEATQRREVALAAVDTNKAELHAILTMIRKAGLPLLSIASERKAAILAAIWTDEALASIAEDGAKVLALHGLKLDNLAGNFGPYVALALSAGPVALGTYAVLKSKDPEQAEEVQGGQQQ